MNYLSRYLNLLRKCKESGITVHLVATKVLHDYAGMNDEIARKLGFKKLPNRTILIDKNMSVKTKYETLVHEIVEMKLMEKGTKYWTAHLKALKAEKRRNICRP